MADYTEEITLPDYKRGDWWPGCVLGPITINDAPAKDFFNANLARVRWHFTLGCQTFRCDSLEAADPDLLISITDAETWLASVPSPGNNFLPAAGVWDFDIEFWPEGNTGPLTFYKGQINCNGDISR